MYVVAPVVLVFCGLGLGIAIRLGHGDMGSEGGSQWLGLPGYMCLRAMQVRSSPSRSQTICLIYLDLNVSLHSYIRLYRFTCFDIYIFQVLT